MSVGAELSPVVLRHIERFIDKLCAEFGEVHSRETIDGLMRDSVQRLAGDAQVDDFVPVLAHRFARERLKALVRAGATESGDVLFIGLGDTGRGQMGAALLMLRSEGRVTAHSAGSTLGTTVDPAVVEVMSELGVDLAEAYAKPLSAEVLGAATVIVTMGRSVGTIEIPDGKRHEDWRVGDPTEAPVDEVRRVRDDVDRRVRALLANLDTAHADDAPPPKTKASPESQPTA